MTIAEQVTQAKADLDAVYVAGYNKGKAEGSSSYDEGYAAGVTEGIEQGRQAEHNAFWDIYQDYGNRYNYARAFVGLHDSKLSYGWNDTTYSPKYPIVLGQKTSDYNARADGVFYYNTALTDTKVDIIVWTNGLPNTFYNCYKLKTIRKLVLNRPVKIWTNTFNQNRELENLTIECGEIDGVAGCIEGNIGIYSHKLSRASITSVINALSTTASGLTATFYKTAVDNAFATASGAADGSTSADWLALVATRPNWTIALA